MRIKRITSNSRAQIRQDDVRVCSTTQNAGIAPAFLALLATHYFFVASVGSLGAAERRDGGRGVFFS
jgi:hypothetical protein